MKGMFTKKARKKGFTLAEVLITIVIIGIVAAITIPSVLARYQEKQTVVKLKKAYSTLNSAYKLAITENGTPDEWGLDVSYGETSDNEEGIQSGYISRDEFLNKIIPYLKTVSVCKHTDENCTTWYGKNLAGEEDLVDKQSNLVVLLDGTVISHAYINSPSCAYEFGEGPYMSQVCGSIKIDLNGEKEPNTYGKDIFEFYTTIMGLYPSGAANITASGHALEKKCLDYSYRLGGVACTAWVIYNENMDYLYCNDLSWNGKKRCR